MTIRGNAGFVYVTPDSEIVTHRLAAPLSFREGLAAHVRTRYQRIALDQRTIDVVSLAIGADEVESIIRFEPSSYALLAMLRHGADGITLNYYPDLDAAESYAFKLMSAVEIRPDHQRFGFGEWEAPVRLRLTDGSSIEQLINRNLVTNPGFETGAIAPHIAGAGGGTWAVGATNPRSGLYALSYDPASQSATARFVLNGGSSAPAGHASVSEGDAVYATLWVRSATAASANRVRIRFDWRTAAGVNVSVLDGSLVTPTSTYAVVSLAGVTPATAAYVVAEIRVPLDGHANILYLDDLFLRAGLAPI